MKILRSDDVFKTYKINVIAKALGQTIYKNKTIEAWINGGRVFSYVFTKTLTNIPPTLNIHFPSPLQDGVFNQHKEVFDLFFRGSFQWGSEYEDGKVLGVQTVNTFDISTAMLVGYPYTADEIEIALKNMSSSTFIEKIKATVIEEVHYDWYAPVVSILGFVLIIAAIAFLVWLISATIEFVVLLSEFGLSTTLEIMGIDLLQSLGLGGLTVYLSGSAAMAVGIYASLDFIGEILRAFPHPSDDSSSSTPQPKTNNATLILNSFNYSLPSASLPELSLPNFHL